MQKSIGNLPLMTPGLSYHVSIRQLNLDMTLVLLVIPTVLKVSLIRDFSMARSNPVHSNIFLANPLQSLATNQPKSNNSKAPTKLGSRPANLVKRAVAEVKRTSDHVLKLPVKFMTRLLLFSIA